MARFHDGESGADVYDRVTAFLDSFFRQMQSPAFDSEATNGRWACEVALVHEDLTAFFCVLVIIVTHGLTLRLFLMRWFHWTVETFEATQNPGTASGTSRDSHGS